MMSKPKRFKGESSPYYGMPLQEMVDIKRANRMAKIDQFDPAIRALIHEYGLHVVDSIYKAGVTNPRRIKHIVETVLDEFSPTRGTKSIQGVRTEMNKPD